MSLAGEAVVSIWHDIAEAGRDQFYWWHLHEHMPERVGIAGFLRGRRYIAEEGQPEFFTLYEAQTLEVLASQDYLNRLNNPTPWTLVTVKHFLHVARSIQRVRHSSGPGIGGYLLTVRFEAADADRLVERMHTDVVAPLATQHGIAGLHLCQTDVSISDTKTKEREQRDGGTDMPGWTLMVEAARRDELDKVLDDHLNERACLKLGMTGDVASTFYRLEYVRSKTGHSA